MKVRRTWRMTSAFIATVLGLGVTLLAFISWRLNHSAPAPSAPTTRVKVSLSADRSLTIRGGVAISPDGQTLALIAGSSSDQRLYIRRLNEWEPRAVPGSEGARDPFFSPDGAWIAFFGSTRGSLEKAPVGGGPPQKICDVSSYMGGSWGRDGQIVFGGFPNVGLLRVSANGGIPQFLARPKGNATQYINPEHLAESDTILFTILREGEMSIAALPPGSTEPRMVLTHGSRARYTQTGHVVFEADGHLVAAPFDRTRLQIHGGAPVAIAEVENGAAAYDVSLNGTLVYVPRGPLDKLVWKGRHGETKALVPLNPRHYNYPALSTDGQRLAVAVSEGPAANIWTGSVEREPLTRLTFGRTDWSALWTPDGRRVVVNSVRDGRYNIFWTSAAGGETVERLTDSARAHHATSWSPTGDLLLFNDIDPSKGGDVSELSIVTKQSRPLLSSPAYNQQDAVFSPDGRWVAYVSDESGTNEVYVLKYQQPAAKTQVSDSGGMAPRWNRNGNELFYQTDTAIMAVPVLDRENFRVGTPVQLFRYTGPSGYYDVHPRGDRFLVVQKGAEGVVPSEVNLVLNWFEELKARVPTK